MTLTKTNYTFPFGESVTLVEQQDRTPKRVFVLGVYASAVHARWVDTTGKTVVTALAVASEPYIFWRGDDVQVILDRIEVLPELGKLLPAAKNLNGPSGIALDEHFLHPLGIKREDTWLCDLVPHSCMNPGQRNAIERSYEPLMQKHGLPTVTLPPVPKQLADEARRNAILDELIASQAGTIILLGDEPIRWFLNIFDNSWRKLGDFGEDAETYGRLHPVQIRSKSYHVLPLVHPRQAARLGAHSQNWHDLHAGWVANSASTLGV